MADKDIEETADELFEEPNGLPEAPASANLKVWIDGYGVQITMRSERVDDVVKKLEFIIAKAKEKGWKPSWKDEPVKDPDGIQETTIKAPSCPKCGGEMVQRTAKKTGNKFWGCSGYPECDGIVDSKKG